ncbi:MAG: hypothetical protein AABW79_02120 [Nanoarchaeota archaeon]
MNKLKKILMGFFVLGLLVGVTFFVSASEGKVLNFGDNSNTLLFDDGADIEVAQVPIIIPSPHLVCFAASNTVYFACMDEYGPYHAASCFEQGIMKRCSCYRTYGIDVGGCYNA